MLVHFVKTTVTCINTYCGSYTYVYMFTCTSKFSWCICCCIMNIMYEETNFRHFRVLVLGTGASICNLWSVIIFWACCIYYRIINLDSIPAIMSFDWHYACTCNCPLVLFCLILVKLEYLKIQLTLFSIFKNYMYIPLTKSRDQKTKTMYTYTMYI